MDCKLGLQLYSVRDLYEKDLQLCLQKAKKAGYDAVEFYGDFLYSASAITEALRQAQIENCGYHCAWKYLQKDMIHASFSYLKQIGTSIVIVPIIDEAIANSREQYEQVAEHFEYIYQVAKQYEMRLGYHAHAVDFRQVEDFIPWDFFFSRFNKDIIMQMDMGNALSAGVLALDYLKKYPERSASLHIKPYNKEKGFDTVIGEDDVDWQHIIPFAKAHSGCKWYVVEHENDDNFKTVAECAKRLRVLLTEK